MAPRRPSPKPPAQRARSAQPSPRTQQRPPSRARATLACGAGIALAAASGCGLIRSIAGTNAVELEGADVRAIRLDLRRPAKSICPREAVQARVSIDAILSGEDAPATYETWEGHEGASMNGKLPFEDFALQGEPGRFDESGWFSPSTDLLATVDRPFSLTAIYRGSPERTRVTVEYPPDYECITSGGGRGIAGKAGARGRDGNPGTAAVEGQTGGDGNIGNTGGNATDGGPAPELVAYATMVKTPFHERLVAVRIEGPTPDFLLFPPGKAVTLKAVGGAGGRGGDGGDGGLGADGGHGNPTPGDGGRGGDGANGGNGGNGGDGGKLELVFDARFPDLERILRLDVSGGAAGEAGRGGRGGRGGKGGILSRRAEAESVQEMGGDGERGVDGAQGRNGKPGRAGAPGTSSSRAGEVAEHFAGIRGITPL